MNVEDLRTKEVKDLNDEQKKFLSDNKSELTDDEREVRPRRQTGRDHRA